MEVYCVILCFFFSLVISGFSKILTILIIRISIGHMKFLNNQKTDLNKSCVISTDLNNF